MATQRNEENHPANRISSGCWAAALGGVALACLVGSVFWPVVGFEFIDLDVPAQVIENPLIRELSAQNLWRIFTTPGCGGSTSSYYPIRTLSYAIDYRLWGLNAGGFELTNALVHLANVLLAYWLILRLFRRFALGATARPWWEASVAAFSAGIFAIHPVVVEPVAWVAGREELLMTLGALGCVHFHITARRLEQTGASTRWTTACRAGAAVCCAAACLSNAVAAIIPALVVCCDVLARPRPPLKRILAGTAVLWLIGAAAIAVKIQCKGESAVALPGVFTRQWLMIIPYVYGCNLRALLWPRGLAISSDWPAPQSFLEAEIVLGAISIVLTILAIWRLRRRADVLLGLFWFGLSLAPSSQILPHHIARADRFLYLPLIGLALAAAACLRPLAGRITGRLAWSGAYASGVAVLLLLHTLSAWQVQTWRNGIAVWENCVSVAPNNALAHSGLADNLARAGRFDLAIPHYYIALRLAPESLEPLNNFALRLAVDPRKDLHDYDLAVRLAEKGCQITNFENPKLRHTLAMACTARAADREQRGEYRLAVDDYEKAIAADPNYDVALFNLALLFSTCPDEEFRRPERAVALSERACRLNENVDFNRLSILAGAYAAAGRFDAAVPAVRRALRVAEASANHAAVAELRAHLDAYLNGEVCQNPP